MAVTGTVTEATRVGNELSVMVQLPDGTLQRYAVSLIDANIKSSLESQARRTVTHVNDVIIKQNLSLVVKGLTLDLTDLPPKDPDPPPTDDDLAVTAFQAVMQQWLLARIEVVAVRGQQSVVDALVDTMEASFQSAKPALVARYRDALRAVRFV